MTLKILWAISAAANVFAMQDPIVAERTLSCEIHCSLNPEVIISLTDIGNTFQPGFCGLTSFAFEQQNARVGPGATASKMRNLTPVPPHYAIHMVPPPKVIERMSSDGTKKVIGSLPTQPVYLTYHGPLLPGEIDSRDIPTGVLVNGTEAIIHIRCVWDIVPRLRSQVLGVCKRESLPILPLLPFMSSVIVEAKKPIGGKKIDYVPSKMAPPDPAEVAAAAEEIKREEVQQLKVLVAEKKKEEQTILDTIQNKHFIPLVNEQSQALIIDTSTSMSRTGAMNSASNLAQTMAGAVNAGSLFSVVAMDGPNLADSEHQEINPFINQTIRRGQENDIKAQLDKVARDSIKKETKTRKKIIRKNVREGIFGTDNMSDAVRFAVQNTKSDYIVVIGDGVFANPDFGNASFDAAYSGPGIQKGFEEADAYAAAAGKKIVYLLLNGWDSGREELDGGNLIDNTHFGRDVLPKIQNLPNSQMVVLPESQEFSLDPGEVKKILEYKNVAQTVKALEAEIQKKEALLAPLK